MTERILSPDGTQYWDGTSWRPVDTAIPAPDLAMSHIVTPAVSPPAGASDVGDRLDRYPHVQAASQILTTYATGPASKVSLGNSWLVNKWAWTVALTSFAFSALLWWFTLVPSEGVGYWAAAFGLAIVASFAVSQDVRNLRRHGVEAQQGFTAVVLLAYVIGAPFYLIYRTVKSRTTPLIPIVWFAGVLSMFAPYAYYTASDAMTEFGDTSFYVPSTESDLEDEMRDLGVRRPTVQCPEDIGYDEGDTIICDVTSGSDGDFEIVLTILNDGYYEWQVQ